MSLVFMFPGPASRYDGMVTRLANAHRAASDLLNLASDVLGRDLRQQYSIENPEAFCSCRDVQVGVFLANHMYLGVVRGAGVTAQYSLGMGVGEYNHLVHIGALDFVQALKLVEQRGLAFDEGPRCAMALVGPVDPGALERILMRVRHEGTAERVIHCSPNRHIISGDMAPVKAAVRLLSDETYAQARLIDVRSPAHTSLMREVGSALRVQLEGTHFTSPRLPYLPNRMGKLQMRPLREAMVDLLSAHVHMPVLWRQSIDRLVLLKPDAVLVQVGPGTSLYDLHEGDWPGHRRYHLDHKDDLAGHLDRVVTELLILAPAETM